MLHSSSVVLMSFFLLGYFMCMNMNEVFSFDRSLVKNEQSQQRDCKKKGWWKKTHEMGTSMEVEQTDE